MNNPKLSLQELGASPQWFTLSDSAPTPDRSFGFCRSSQSRQVNPAACCPAAVPEINLD
jgi:hypothetical protein